MAEQINLWMKMRLITRLEAAVFVARLELIGMVFVLGDVGMTMRPCGSSTGVDG